LRPSTRLTTITPGCAQFLAANWSRLVVPSLAVTEICHLLADPRRGGRSDLAAEFCAAIADDELRVIEVIPHDYRRMAELLTTYSSLRLQAVDACVVALAERLDLHEVAALDRRDFQVVAPRHLPKGQRLRLLPE
jgi:predicted nucleic acid-binding protein